MDSELMAALRESTRHVLWTTMQLPAEVAAGEVVPNATSGEFAIESDQGGGRRLTFAATAETAERLASLFSGRDASDDDDACADAIGELASMILARALATPDRQFDRGTSGPLHQRSACVEVRTEYGMVRVAMSCLRSLEGVSGE